MIAGLSRFKVANGFEAQVKEAFLHRPHLVDHVPGFLGMETFTEEKDGTAFYLLTRWTDAESFRAWHASPAHHASHRGIPKGLKLDPTFTKLWVLDRLADPAATERSLREYVDDHGELLAGVLAGSESLYFLVASHDGIVAACNGAIADALGVAEEELVGSCLWERLAEEERLRVEEKIASGVRSPNERFPLAFSITGGDPLVLSCWLDVQPARFTIVAEPALNRHAGYDAELFGLNNELAVLARENSRRGRELVHAKAKLQETLDELNRTHWHLRKIAEVLPMCVQCGYVSAGEGEWQTVTDYLRENSLFLSHGCCPACVSSARTELGVA